MTSAFHHGLNVAEENDHWIVSYDFGKVQPKAREWTPNAFYIGSFEATTLQLEGILYADNLPSPIRTPLTIEIVPEPEVQITMDVLRRFVPDPDRDYDEDS